MQTDALMTSCGGMSDPVGHITPEDQQNGEIQEKPIKEEEHDEEYFCKLGEHRRVSDHSNNLVFRLDRISDGTYLFFCFAFVKCYFISTMELEMERHPALWDTSPLWTNTMKDFRRSI